LGEARDAIPLSLEMFQESTLVLAATLGEHVRVWPAPRGRLPPPFRLAAIEAGEMPAGEMVCEVGCGETKLAADELHAEPTGSRGTGSAPPLLRTDLRISTRAPMSSGFVRWAWNPTRWTRRTSSSCPYPVRASTGTSLA